MTAMNGVVLFRWSIPHCVALGNDGDEVAMSLDTAINILVTVTLIEMMVLIGLQVTFAEIVNTART
jgi:hypothetical protein